MSKCDKCSSVNILSVNGKCNDLVYLRCLESEQEGEAPEEVSVMRGDYIRFAYCLDCGKVQGVFPQPVPDFAT